MPGERGRITFSGPGGSMYLGDTVGIFREGDYIKLTRVGHQDVHLGVRRNGNITNGEMLFRLLDDLWNSESNPAEVNGER
jgi:hypothetical protein